MGAISVLEHFALDGRKFPRHLLDSETGDLLIVGTGRCLWQDVLGVPETPNVMTVNDAIMYWPGVIKHSYSNDVEQLVHWAEGRRKPLVQLYGAGGKLHSCFARSHLSNVNHWPVPGQGSSGLVAIFVALMLGFDNITVAGLPFDNSGHFYDPPESHNLRRDHYWSNFLNETPDRLIKRSLPLFRGKVRAISGRLKEALEG